MITHTYTYIHIQSLFSRFIRLQVPYIQLDMQGRARKEIADLYRWRYQNLKDLPRIANTRDEYATANPGVYIHIHLYIHIHIHIYIHFIHTHEYTYTYIHTHAYTSTHIHPLYTSTHIHIHIIISIYYYSYSKIQKGLHIHISLSMYLITMVLEKVLLQSIFIKI